MWWPLAIAVPLLVAGTALLVLSRMAARKRPQVEMVPMSLLTPSRPTERQQYTSFASNPSPDPDRDEPEAAPPAVPDEPKLSPKQRERLDRLMAAVKAEFNTLLEEEKRKSRDQ